jgi:hypothetical protein
MTEGSSGRPVMTDEQNESGAKSVQPQATGTNKRVLHGSIIRDKPNDASLESEVLFHKGAGSPPLVNIPADFDRESNLANPSGLRETPWLLLARDGRTGLNTCILPSVVLNARPTLLNLLKHRALPHRLFEVRTGSLQ